MKTLLASNGVPSLQILALESMFCYQYSTVIKLTSLTLQHCVVDMHAYDRLKNFKNRSQKMTIIHLIIRILATAFNLTRD